MGSIGYWTMVVVLYQTIICMLISYLTLGCHLPPERNELRELTLMKILYLHEPKACNRIYFYNYTVGRHNRQIYSNVVWPMYNHVAESFRCKLKVWLSLHVIWALLAFANLFAVTQPCKFYMISLPFATTGTVMLVVDIVFMSFFISDSKYTETEADIFLYIDNKKNMVNSINSTLMTMFLQRIPSSDDLSWIALLMAYFSCRAIVQWIINFWVIKDNFVEGLELYRRFQHRVMVIRKRSMYIP